ncbi:hypothetical protein ASO20_01740 [Mycoplasma sp. (ex Biomphalaria glabrata)]|uniref:sigma-70 family RNA polymerase sigma factor n=1 Tax=Mycoplasma sp. (ex Biomphalaria glabrata) TaxID=1749074 RepID=UPI00073A8BCA|nr:sigma-70 family RNA polymerase sigma factor [Mycoplasma sp. (ex Biomphalaria glabrata)]ALV23370.1 hypothetical protein ASO20_01740 [Mycoplasma sp. (ex Biomphalaria glabrata)]
MEIKTLEIITSQSDEFLALVYKDTSQESIIFQLMEKYNDRFNILIKQLLRKYSSIALYEEDFYFNKYIAVKKSLDCYNPESNYQFVQFLIRTFKCLISDYARKFTRNKHVALNYAIRNGIEDYHIEIAESNDVEFDIYQKNLVRNVINGKEKLTSIEKSILLMRVRGYTPEEISYEMSMPIKAVHNAYYRAVTKLKQNYKYISN